MGFVRTRAILRAIQPAGPACSLRDGRLSNAAGVYEKAIALLMGRQIDGE
jgi:hypothetical protein